MSTPFFSDLLASIADRGRAVLNLPPRRSDAMGPGDLAEGCRALVSRRGEASGMALARDILARWEVLGPDARRSFLVQLAEEFGPDTERLDAAITKWHETPSPQALIDLHAAAEPKRQELIRRLNLAPDGTRQLVAMRAELLRHRKDFPVLEALDTDLRHLFSSWFNRGFLVLRRIGWSTPANILEKIIRYEAVHAIKDWDELRRRIKPDDRRLFAFFHPQMVDEPLIFLQVALTAGIPGAIAPLLADGREPIAASNARTAVFYSISNCQEGLRGISFGHFLIKQVVEELIHELPKLNSLVTLSPMPGFASWLARQRMADAPEGLTPVHLDSLRELDGLAWLHNAPVLPGIEKALTAAAAWYLLKAKTPEGWPLDPIARFHLGNGARVERINFRGDMSAKGLKQSHGLMVNYLYDIENIERNHEAYAERGEVIAVPAVRRRLTVDLPSRALTPVNSEALRRGTKATP